MNPRDSIPTTTSICSPRYLSASMSTTARKAGPSLSSVVMSLKRMPSVGKSLMSRILARSSAISMCRYLTRSGGVLHRLRRGRRSSPQLGDGRGQRGEADDGNVGAPGAQGLEGRARDLDGPHPRRARALHVEDGVVAHVHGFAGIGAERTERERKDLRIRLADQHL